VKSSTMGQPVFSRLFMVATSIQPQSTQPQSALPVVIKRLDADRWSAEVLGWPDARADGVDREDVQRNLWDRISHLLVNADIVSVQLHRLADSCVESFPKQKVDTSVLVLVEQHELIWSACVLCGGTCSAEGPSREAVLHSIEQQYVTQIIDADIIPFKIPTPLSEHPWMSFAGIWNELDAAEFAAEIDAERRRDDELEQQNWMLRDKIA
jgi:hypothetical protein